MQTVYVFKLPVVNHHKYQTTNSMNTHHFAKTPEKVALASGGNELKALAGLLIHLISQ